jgi:hypothetical protein
MNAPRLSLTPQSTIKAEILDNGLLRWVEVDERLGNVLSSYQAVEGSTEFRHLVRAARAYIKNRI